MRKRVASGAGDVAQVVQCLSIVGLARGPIPSLHRVGVVAIPMISELGDVSRSSGLSSILSCMVRLRKASSQ